MHLNELRADNFKRLRAVRIAFPEGGGAVEICGRNGQGKSSTIDAIWAALGGSKASPDVPIRTGARKAEVTLDLGEIKVVRSWDSHGTRLTVTGADGTARATPQAILDGLFNRLGFDPIAFVGMKPKDQADALRRITGLDFTRIDAERKTLYDRRTEVNRLVAQHKARLAAMPTYEPTEPVDVADLNRQLREATRANAESDRLVKAEIRAEGALQDCDVEIDRLERELADARVMRQTALTSLEQARAARADGPRAIDPEPIMDQIQTASAINERAQACRERESLEQRLADAEETAARFTDKIDDLDAYRQRLLVEARMPVEGLSLDGDEVTLNGVPLAQASSAERIRVGLAMAAAMNPGLKLVAIREGSLLDEASLRLVAGWAEENGYQVLVERVAAEPAGVGVVIEEGEVKEAKGVRVKSTARRPASVPSFFDDPHASDGGADLS